MTLESKRKIWTQRIEEWRQSGKSVKAWCHEHSFVYTTFLGWVSRLEKVKSSLPTFSFVELKSPSPTSSGIVLKYKDVLIEVSSDFDLSTLNRCLQVLRGNQC